LVARYSRAIWHIVKFDGKATDLPAEKMSMSPVGFFAQAPLNGIHGCLQQNSFDRRTAEG